MPIKNAKNIDERNFIIYGLCDPETGELRYIGFTVDKLTKRLYRHMNSKEKNHRTNWINKIKDKGLKPEIFKIADTDINNYQEDEMFYIAYFKSIGCNLVNATIGGEGWLGMKHRKEAKQIDSEQHRKLTDSQVREIIEKYHNENYTQLELAEEYGLSKETILRIVNNDKFFMYLREKDFFENIKIKDRLKPTGKRSLNKEQVLEIQKRIGEGISNKDLASKFAVDQAVISNIRHKKAYVEYLKK